MQVLSSHMSTQTHRFASPLDISYHSRSYYSSHTHDCLFGALHNAYSTSWTGSSFVHPDFKIKTITKAIRWAVASATAATAPTCTVILAPAWKNASFMSWISHANMVQVLTLDTDPAFRFTAPDHMAHIYTATQPTYGTPKWPLQLLIIATRRVSLNSNMFLFSLLSLIPSNHGLILPTSLALHLPTLYTPPASPNSRVHMPDGHSQLASLRHPTHTHPLSRPLFYPFPLPIFPMSFSTTSVSSILYPRMAIASSILH